MQLAEVSGVVQVAQMLALSTENFVHNAYSAKAARGGRVRAAEQKSRRITPATPIPTLRSDRVECKLHAPSEVRSSQCVSTSQYQSERR